MNETLGKVEEFLKAHHTLSLSTCKDNIPSSCTLFYAYEPIKQLFIVASDEKTEHIKNVLQNPQISGTVHLETDVVGKIQGLQFKGDMSLCEDEKILYFKKFPYALAMNPTLWKIEVNFFKLTDNRLGFGKKLIWNR